MKKTVNVSLGQATFALEEDAYQKLREYLDSLKKHYTDPGEREEILNDIEAGLAEKFQAGHGRKKKVVNLKDVAEAIKVMGSVEEIAGAEEDAKAGDAEGSSKEDEESGAAEEATAPKKLYRNPDDAILAGVGSGIAAFFGIDPVLVRLAFVVVTLFTGFGILMYLVLWVIMPKAETSAQKLEMRGKPVNLAGLEAAVKQKSKKLTEKGKKALEENKGTFRKILELPVKVVEVVVNFLKKLFKHAGPVLLIVVGVALCIGAVGGLFGATLFTGLMLFGLDLSFIHSDLPLMEMTSGVLYQVTLVSLYFVLIVPFIFLLFSGISLAKRKSIFSLGSSFTLLGIWLLAITSLVVCAVRYVPQVREKLMNGVYGAQTIVRNYDELRDFNRVRVEDNYRVNIVQGDHFEVRAAGKEVALDRLELVNENGELIVRQKELNEFCFVCLKDIDTVEVVMPELTELYGDDISRVKLVNFKQDELNLNLVDGARVETENLETKVLRLKQDDASRAVFNGKTEAMLAELKDASRLAGFNFTADRALVKVTDVARAEVSVKAVLKAIAKDNGRISYQGDPEVTKEVEEWGRVEQVDPEAEVEEEFKQVEIIDENKDLEWNDLN